jgi:hypothetical protein
MMTFSAKMTLCIAAFQCKKVFAAGSEGSQPNTFLMDNLKKLHAVTKAFANPRQALREFAREPEKAKFQTLQAGLENLTATIGDKLRSDEHWNGILQAVDAGIFILETK